MSQFKHRPRKRFGQHFLTCDMALSSMVHAIGPARQTRVVEIGPGPGVLTAELVGTAEELTVIEIDRDLVARLKKRFAGQSIRIIEADVLLFDFSSLLSIAQPACVVGNLPYNISTPLMFRLFEHLESISSCFFLLQKEVVDRLCAAVGTKQYGRLSVMAQYYCDARSLFDVPPTAFSPPPKVDSSFVQLTPHAVKPAVANNFSCFSNVVKEAFCYRRKMLKKIFKSMVTPDQWEALGIDSTLRPEQVGVAEFVALSNEVARSYESRGHE